MQVMMPMTQWPVTVAHQRSACVHLPCFSGVGTWHLVAYGFWVYLAGEALPWAPGSRVPCLRCAWPVGGSPPRQVTHNKLTGLEEMACGRGVCQNPLGPARSTSENQDPETALWRILRSENLSKVTSALPLRPRTSGGTVVLLSCVCGYSIWLNQS
jgi:hypothetical protein